MRTKKDLELYIKSLKQQIEEYKTLAKYWEDKVTDSPPNPGPTRVQIWERATRQMIREELSKLQVITTWKGGPTNVQARLWHPDLQP